MQSRRQILVNFNFTSFKEALKLFSPCRVVKANGLAGSLAAELTPTACIDGHANIY